MYKEKVQAGVNNGPTLSANDPLLFPSIDGWDLALHLLRLHSQYHAWRWGPDARLGGRGGPSDVDTHDSLSGRHGEEEITRDELNKSNGTRSGERHDGAGVLALRRCFAHCGFEEVGAE